jgi:hypothetical protein
LFEPTVNKKCAQKSTVFVLRVCHIDPLGGIIPCGGWAPCCDNQVMPVVDGWLAADRMCPQCGV